VVQCRLAKLLTELS